MAAQYVSCLVLSVFPCIHYMNISLSKVVFRYDVFNVLTYSMIIVFELNLKLICDMES